MQKKITHKLATIGLLVGILFGIHQAVPSFAVSVDPDSTASSGDEAVNDELVKRIEKVVEEKKEQVKQVLGSLVDQREGFIGEVQRISGETLTLTTSNGTRIVPISSEVSLTKASKTIDVEDIAVGNWVEILGTLDADAFAPQHVLVYENTLRPTPQKVFIGTVTDLTTTSMTVVPRDTTMPEVEVALLRSTDFQDANGEDASRTDFSEDGAVLVVALEEDDETEAQTIRSLVPLEELE